MWIYREVSAGKLKDQTTIDRNLYVYNMENMSGSRKRGYGRKLDSNMCHVCEKLLQSPSHLRRHMLSHTGERQYYYSVNDSRGTGNDDIQKPSLKHVCPICSRPFPSSSGLSRHLLTHTGEKPFECEVCDKDNEVLMVSVDKDNEVLMVSVDKDNEVLMVDKDNEVLMVSVDKDNEVLMVSQTQAYGTLQRNYLLLNTVATHTLSGIFK
ncbi:histone-lysine N-methyltransferase PRDM16-like [Ruditapes philippinarum]|uniref:histone-lysine N-methyltransferase PRDM16-like n=1 Tax=Ruditapes philippinarum TaxID=129788 RepID=UPI00295B6F89|nr:histone-lysine N-methyltransferase PRDM16-like [Ruditapes philippinarum]